MDAELPVDALVGVNPQAMLTTPARKPDDPERASNATRERSRDELKRGGVRGISFRSSCFAKSRESCVMLTSWNSLVGKRSVSILAELPQVDIMCLLGTFIGNPNLKRRQKCQSRQDRGAR